MQRVKFRKGEQRRFLKSCMDLLNVNSLRGLLQFGIKTNYSSLKNYYTERRLLPYDLFLDLCHLIKKNPEKFNFSALESNWGQIIGGRN